jgi:hypothetical protein
MNKIQSAFAYLLSLLAGAYGDGWEISEAYADTAIEFGLDDLEVEQLKQLQENLNAYKYYN